MDFDTALKLFAIALGDLKQAYADEYNVYRGYITILVDDDDYVTIIPTNEEGHWIDAHREQVDTDE